MTRTRKIVTAAIFALLALPVCFVPALAKDRLDASTAASGLKEALQNGTAKAVELLGQSDGYLGNPDVRIPIPDKLSFMKKALKTIGKEDLIQEFKVSMNRAAEAAAPLAAEVFADTIKEMSFSDAMAIVRGKEHEATDYLREHAGATLRERFRPIVDEQMNNVGATEQFNQMMGATSDLPFVKKPVFDLGEYVTDGSLDGMFLMIAREEEKIRKDPLARTSDLLKTVFGGDQKKKKKSSWRSLLGGD